MLTPNRDTLEGSISALELWARDAALQLTPTPAASNLPQLFAFDRFPLHRDPPRGLPCLTQLLCYFRNHVVQNHDVSKECPSTFLGSSLRWKHHAGRHTPMLSSSSVSRSLGSVVGRVERRRRQSPLKGFSIFFWRRRIFQLLACRGRRWIFRAARTTAEIDPYQPFFHSFAFLGVIGSSLLLLHFIYLTFQDLAQLIL